MPGKKNSHYVHNAELLRCRYLTYPKFYTSMQEFYDNHYFNSCWAGKFAVTSQGDIIPCIFARSSICGNVKKDTFEEIKTKLNSLWSISKDCV